MKRPAGAELDAAFDDLVSMAITAHRLIQAAVEGRPLDFNRLENYFKELGSLTQTLDAEGVLGEALLQDLAGELPDEDTAE